MFEEHYPMVKNRFMYSHLFLRDVVRTAQIQQEASNDNYSQN